MTRPTTIDGLEEAFDALTEGDAPAKQQQESTPQFFGSYQIINEIGHGGAAVVLRARHIHPSYAGRNFALKLLHADLAADPEVQEPFRKEAYLLSLLKHPNIVQTFEAGVEDGKMFIAMEFINGKDLFDLLERCKQLGRKIPYVVLMHILGEVLRGMTYAHEIKDPEGEPLSIVHHDVNPTNVFMSFNGDVKLGDFGVAGITSMKPQRGSETAGKVGYFAPEQFTDKQVDQRVDIFTFGVTMYELLCGVPPFDAPTNDEVMELNSQAIVPPMGRFSPPLHKGLVKLILKSLERKMTRRWTTAREMLDALEPYLPNPTGMRLVVAAYMRNTFLNEHIQELRLRQSLAGRDGETRTGKRVALWSDDAALRGLWEGLLEPRGFMLQNHETLATLCSQIGGDSPPNVIVVDISSKRFDPRQLTDAIAASGRLVPIVATTSNLEPDGLVLADALGVSELLVDPLSADRAQTALWTAMATAGKQDSDALADDQTALHLPVLLVTVDDELGDRLGRELAEWDYIVDVAPSFSEGIGRAENTTYHAAIFDLPPEQARVARGLAEDLRACTGMGVIPVVYVVDKKHHARLAGVVRSGVKTRDEKSVVLANLLNQLRADRRNRSFVRYQATFPVEMRYSGRSFDGTAADISRGGLMIRCEEMPPVGTAVGMVMRIGDHASPLECRGQVVHLLLPPEGSGKLPGIGVEFDRMSAYSDEMLVAYIRGLTPE